MTGHVVIEVQLDGTREPGGALRFCPDEAFAVRAARALNENAVNNGRRTRYRAYRLEPVQEDS